MFEVAATIARGFSMGIAAPLDFTTYCGETVKQGVSNPTFASTSKAHCRHSVCATCQQHRTWFAKLYWLEINVAFRSRLGNPSSLACIFVGFLICPRQRKPNAINAVLNDSQLIHSHQVSSLSASLCLGTYTHSCQINKIN